MIITDAFDSVATAIGKRLGLPQLTDVGIGAFQFAAIVSRSLDLQSDTPDTVMEDGSNVQDHIILKPKTIKINGSVGNVFRTQTPISALLAKVRAEIGAVSHYLPARTQAQIQRANGLISDVQDRVQRVERIIEDGQQVLSVLGDLTGLGSGKAKTLPEQFLDMMEAYHDSRELFSVRMPFRTFEKMCMVSLTITQGNEKDSLEFDMSLKQMRFASTTTVAVSWKGKPSSGLSKATNPIVKKAGQQPAPVLSSSWANTFFGGIYNFGSAVGGGG